MLNSVSSWPKAAPVSAALSSLASLVEALALADDQLVDGRRAAIAIVGEILQDFHGAAGELHDGHQVGLGHLRLMNFWAAASARNWSGTGIAVMSK